MHERKDFKWMTVCVASVEALRKKERQDETQFHRQNRKDRMKLSLPSKLVGKLVWVPVISFCKIFIPSYAFDAPVTPETDRSRPP
jgi:hypothetical protein